MDKERRTPRVGFSSTPKLEIQVSAKQEGDIITLVNSEYLPFHPQREPGACPRGFRATKAREEGREK